MFDVLENRSSRLNYEKTFIVSTWCFQHFVYRYINIYLLVCAHIEYIFVQTCIWMCTNYYGVWCQSPKLPCCIYSLASLTPVLWLSHQFHHGKAIQVRPVQVISVRICPLQQQLKGIGVSMMFEAPFARESSMK